MKTQKRFSIPNYFVVLFAFGLLFSCEQLAPVEEPVHVSEEFVDMSGIALEPEDDPIGARLVYSSDCESDCIEPGSGNYFAIRDSKSKSSGINTKKVSYKAYNTEDRFVVKAKYEITAGPSQAKASITIQINGKKKEFKSVPSGYTATFSIPLSKGWDKCDQVTFSIVQKGLGSTISFSEDYNLIPVCSEGLEIGMPFQGGIIAYIFQPGDPGYDANQIHGLIAAPSDQSVGAIWGCFETSIPGANGIAIGTGAANTIAIVNGCGEAGIAARLCYDLVLNGYSDWFLPSKDELNKLYLNRLEIGGFGDVIYWSSSEIDFIDVWIQSFAHSEDGVQYNLYKDFKFNVRAVRAF